MGKSRPRKCLPQWFAFAKNEKSLKETHSMDIYVVIEGYPNMFHNDWRSFEYLEDVNCAGVYSTLELAATSLSLTVADLTLTNVNTNVLALGPAWTNFGTHEFIVKRTLDAK